MASHHAKSPIASQLLQSLLRMPSSSHVGGANGDDDAPAAATPPNATMSPAPLAPPPAIEEVVEGSDPLQLLREASDAGRRLPPYAPAPADLKRPPRAPSNGTAVPPADVS